VFVVQIYAIENEGLLDILEHPSKDKYNHQLLFIVRISNDVLVVPAVKEARGMFLKTAYYSRKMKISPRTHSQFTRGYPVPDTGTLREVPNRP